jgi:hypothetical protein
VLTLLQHFLTKNRLIMMLKNLFKPKKTDDELRKERYAESLKTVTEFYNGVRINETLVGKIRATRMDEVFHRNTDNIKIESSIPRPTVYDKEEKVEKEITFLGWMELVRDEARAIINKNLSFDKQEKEYQENAKKKMQEEALERKRVFLTNYGLLTKQVA